MATRPSSRAHVPFAAEALAAGGMPKSVGDRWTRRSYTPEAEALLARLCGQGEEAMYSMNVPRAFEPPRPATSLGLTRPAAERGTGRRASSTRKGKPAARDGRGTAGDATPPVDRVVARSVDAHAALGMERLDRLREGKYVDSPAPRTTPNVDDAEHQSRPMPLVSQLHEQRGASADTRLADAARIDVPPRLGDWLDSWEQRFTPSRKARTTSAKTAKRHAGAAQAMRVREWSKARLDQLKHDVADMEYFAYRPIDDELGAVSAELAADPDAATGPDELLDDGSAPAPSASSVNDELRKHLHATASALQNTWSTIHSLQAADDLTSAAGFEGLQRYAELAGSLRATPGGASGLSMLDAVLRERRRLLAATVAAHNLPSGPLARVPTQAAPAGLLARADLIEEAREAKDVLEGAGLGDGREDVLRLTNGGGADKSSAASNAKGRYATIEKPHPGLFDASQADECLGALHAAQLAVARRAPELARPMAIALLDICRCFEDFSAYCARTEGAGSPHLAVLQCAVDALGGVIAERDNTRRHMEEANVRIAELEGAAEVARERERELAARCAAAESRIVELEREGERHAIRLRRAEEHIAELTKGPTVEELLAESERLASENAALLRRGRIALSQMSAKEIELYEARTKKLQVATGEGECALPHAFPPPPPPPEPKTPKDKKKRKASGRKK